MTKKQQELVVAKAELIEKVIDSIKMMLESDKPLGTKFDQFWFNALGNYTHEQIQKAYDRFISEHKSTKMIMPGKFMEYRHKPKDLETRLDETAETLKPVKYRVDFPEALKNKFKINKNERGNNGS